MCSDDKGRVKKLLAGLAITSFVLIASAAAAHADRGDLPRVRALFADADAPVFALTFRGAMRAKLGSLLPLVRGESQPGFFLALSPLVELHEPNGSDRIVPSQYWRAHISLDPSYAWQGDTDSYRLGLIIEHESDHESAHRYSRPGFLTLNALGARGQAQWTLGALRIGASPALRFYAISCTSDRARCENLTGDMSFGGQLELSLDAPSVALLGLHPFASLSGFAILRHALVRGESHTELHLGLWNRLSALLMQLFVLAYAGNDVGIKRAERAVYLGIGLSLAFLP